MTLETSDLEGEPTLASVEVLGVGGSFWGGGLEKSSQHEKITKAKILGNRHGKSHGKREIDFPPSR